MYQRTSVAPLGAPLWLPPRIRSDIYPLRSERFVVVARHRGRKFKICSIQFAEPLEVFVHLPYFTPLQGLVGRYLLDAPPGQSMQIRLHEGGHVTEEVVKYSHHADGRVRFSNKTVWCIVENRSAPLSELDGHLFTVMLWGWEAFKPATRNDEDPPSRKRAMVEFELVDSTIGGAKIVGWWNPLKRMGPPDDHAPPSPDKSRHILTTSDGVRRHATFVAPPADWRSADAWMAVTIEPLVLPEPPRGPFLLLQGGFGREQRDDGGLVDDLSMLIAQYRDMGPELERLKLELGLIDLSAWELDDASGLLLTGARRRALSTE